ncbi:MAG: hypothetical protein ACYCW6_23885 [Candidatus Xenobia bacterium]
MSQRGRINTLAPVHPGQEATLAHVPPGARGTIEVDYMFGKFRAHGLDRRTPTATVT